MPQWSASDWHVSVSSRCWEFTPYDGGWSAFGDALDGWLNGYPSHGEIATDVYRRLGPPSDVKRWLVRLYRHRTRVLQRNDEQFARLVEPPESGTPHA